MLHDFCARREVLLLMKPSLSSTIATLMPKMLLVFSVLAGIFLYHFSHHMTTSASLERVILNPDGTPSRPLKELFKILELPVPATAKEMNEVAQKKFLRPKDKERWQMEDRFENKRVPLLRHFQKWGMIGAVAPRSKQYDAFLILGATVDTMRQRILYLQAFWQKGARPKSIVFLCGDRPLDFSIEKEALKLKGSPKTEFEAATALWQSLIVEKDLREHPVHFIKVPLSTNSKTGEKKRPNTRDTVLAFLATTPKAGKYLAFSNNPYIVYQDLVFRRVLEEKGLTGSNVYLETVGPAAEEPKMSVLLDNIARSLYEDIRRTPQENGF